MEVLDCIYKRRSIRRYTEQRVSDENLITLIKAATAAPSACNSQPWEFIIVTDDIIMKEMKKSIFFGHYNASSAIIVCGNMKYAMSGPVKDFWIQDCSAAIENILLTATSLGLGTCWIGLHPVESNTRPLYKIFNIPKEVIPLAIIYVGYPAEEKESRTQYNEKHVYWQKYETRKHRTRKKNTKFL